MKTSKEVYRCLVCYYEFEIEVEYTRYIPAQTYGPPESCSPEEGGDFCILGDDKCPKCGTQVNIEEAKALLFESLEDDRFYD